LRAERHATSPPPPESTALTAVVTLTDVRKAFRTSLLVGRARVNVALDGVSLEIADGESVGLVGETGSGKTTIARAILGLTTPDARRIDIAGIDVSDYQRLKRAQRRQVHRAVQVVFQDPYASLNPARSIGATLREVLAVRGEVTDPQRDVTQLLGQVGLPAGYATRRPAALSGGERQRVAIARALALRPRLLICDEPVAALDMSARAQVLELLREIRRQHGMSMLFITHDLAVVRQMADRVAVLYQGQIVETGDTASVLDNPRHGSVLDNPRHGYTRRLPDAVPANTQPARVLQVPDEEPERR
jgi:peptide/nickel transport system ATP-binding protein